MDLNRGKLGLVRLFVVYNLFAGVVWAVRGMGAGPTPFMMGVHLVLALVMARWSFRKANGALPWILWILAWMEIGWLYRLTVPLVHDSAVLAVDLALFGQHLHLTLPSTLPASWLREFMGAAYLSYYLLILGPPILLAVWKRRRALREHTLGLMATYLSCFAVYLVLPVLGPRAAQAAGAGHVPEPPGHLAEIMHTLFAAGDSLGTAFPSSHCAASVAAAVMVRRHFGPVAGIWAGLWAGLIVISTVYTGNHYAADAAGGIGLALGVTLMVRFWLEGRPLVSVLSTTGQPRWKSEGGRS